MTVTDHLRRRLLGRAGLTNANSFGSVPTLDVLRQTEWSAEFESRIRAPLQIGAFRHGRFGSKQKRGYDCIGSIVPSG